MQALHNEDGTPIPETVLCEEHVVAFTPSMLDIVHLVAPDWDAGMEPSRVDEVMANRYGLRCQVCGDQDASDS